MGVQKGKRATTDKKKFVSKHRALVARKLRATRSKQPKSFTPSLEKTNMAMMLAQKVDDDNQKIEKMSYLYDYTMRLKMREHKNESKSPKTLFDILTQLQLAELQRMYDAEVKFRESLKKNPRKHIRENKNRAYDPLFDDTCDTCKEKFTIDATKLFKQNETAEHVEFGDSIEKKDEYEKVWLDVGEDEDNEWCGIKSSLDHEKRCSKYQSKFMKKHAVVVDVTSDLTEKHYANKWPRNVKKLTWFDRVVNFFKGIFKRIFGK